MQKIGREPSNKQESSPVKGQPGASRDSLQIMKRDGSDANLIGRKSLGSVILLPDAEIGHDKEPGAGNTIPRSPAGNVIPSSPSIQKLVKEDSKKDIASGDLP
eukprot:UN18867